MSKINTTKRWLKLFSGLLLLSGLIAVLGWCEPPLGETVKHNIEENIDATPIFYGDVENMGELEEGVRELRENSAK